MSLKKRKILFLDRDGTLCHDDGAFHAEIKSYAEVLAKQKPFDGVKEALKLAKDKGYLLVVISNQAGVGKGKFTENDVHEANRLLQEKLDNVIDGFYYCPHAPSDNCDCRKPMPGMLIQCEKHLMIGKIQTIGKILKDIEATEVDKDNSYMIGDKWIDLLAGEHFGVKSIFVMSGEGEVEYKEKKDLQKELPKDFTIYKDLPEFIKHLEAK